MMFFRRELVTWAWLCGTCGDGAPAPSSAGSQYVGGAAAFNNQIIII